MRNISATIAAAHFVATAEQVRQLAGVVVEGNTADGTYLRVVLAHLQAKLGVKPRRGRRAAAANVSDMEALNAVHETLYPEVLKGVGPDDLDTNERNRRANFARSATSTVRYFIERHGDVRTVDVSTATKGGLRKAVQPQATAPPEGETRVERAFRKAQDALVRSAQRLLERGDPETAAQQIEAAMDALQTLLDALPQEAAPAPAQDFGGQTTTIAGQQPPGRGRGAPAGAILHRPAG